MDEFGWVFHGGRIRTYSSGAKAGNTVLNVVPLLPTGGNARWRILWGKLRLDCGIAVANRQATPQLTDGTNVLLDLGICPIVVASGGQTTEFKAGQAAIYGASENVAAMIVLPNPCILETPEQFRIVINAGDAGDTYSLLLKVLEVPIP
jgi:hypothetical protein